jgi:hypothetical protein
VNPTSTSLSTATRRRQTTIRPNRRPTRTADPRRCRPGDSALERSLRRASADRSAGRAQNPHRAGPEHTPNRRSGVGRRPSGRSRVGDRRQSLPATTAQNVAPERRPLEATANPRRFWGPLGSPEAPSPTTRSERPIQRCRLMTTVRPRLRRNSPGRSAGAIDPTHPMGRPRRSPRADRSVGVEARGWARAGRAPTRLATAQLSVIVPERAV